MRFFILFTIFLSFSFLNVRSQTLKRQICSQAWQQRPAASAIWNFEENGDFVAILFWVNKKKSGFIAKKGKFSIDDSTKIFKIDFDTTYGLYSKDSFSISRDSDSQEWHLIAVSDYKILLSRPPIWEFEKKSSDNNNKNIIVTLVRGKRRRSDLKQKA
jgi:hypothetical protein